jgi:hypothetical protein
MDEGLRGEGRVEGMPESNRFRRIAILFGIALPA